MSRRKAHLEGVIVWIAKVWMVKVSRLCALAVGVDAYVADVGEVIKAALGRHAVGARVGAMRRARLALVVERRDEGERLHVGEIIGGHVEERSVLVDAIARGVGRLIENGVQHRALASHDDDGGGDAGGEDRRGQNRCGEGQGRPFEKALARRCLEVGDLLRVCRHVLVAGR